MASEPPWFLGMMWSTSRVAAAVGEHLLAALLSESVKALAAQLQQLVALGVAQLLPAHQVVGASLVAGDAVEGEPCPPCA